MGFNKIVLLFRNYLVNSLLKHHKYIDLNKTLIATHMSLVKDKLEKSKLFCIGNKDESQGC